VASQLSVIGYVTRRRWTKFTVNHVGFLQLVKVE
jgi:hypothetical protein